MWYQILPEKWKGSEWFLLLYFSWIPSNWSSSLFTNDIFLVMVTRSILHTDVTMFLIAIKPEYLINNRWNKAVLMIKKSHIFFYTSECICYFYTQLNWLDWAVYVIWRKLVFSFHIFSFSFLSVTSGVYIHSCIYTDTWHMHTDIDTCN